MKSNYLNRQVGIKLASLVATALLSLSAQAAVINLGAAQGYSGFFFGDVNAASDVEGRLAVGGNLTSGFDVGYRNAYGSSEPSLVVKGNVRMKNDNGYAAGTIYNGPKYYVENTNSTIGPAAAPWVTAQTKLGNIVYGGQLDAPGWNQYNTATKNANYIDFAAAKTQLSGLSTQLAGMAQTAGGGWKFENDGLKLTGDGTDKPQVFNVGNTELKNISFANIGAKAAVIINSTLGNAVFSGDVGGDKADSPDAIAQHRDRIIFNLVNATAVNISTFVNGAVLAIGANVIGSGHLEGTLIANSLSKGPNGKVELGYEPFHGFTTPVPEPVTYVMMLAGLGAIGFAARRRNKG
ncbi:choice-of-anchor A family protein [Paucibacter sp. TC2R-5]|uniref:choice-of-anchor A family protein n=1 Tax=Paucibacter sp. TC2R-5 TaxID=2893555 RepID=UPI0021E44A9B|nr:collagen-binding domain-containing protein [Paucibacter sp. TC2R-5]MCV2357440.1 choice-of-anchor A family protein [Paucibacter sp. TC2R-5]